VRVTFSHIEDIQPGIQKNLFLTAQRALSIFIHNFKLLLVIYTSFIEEASLTAFETTFFEFTFVFQEQKVYLRQETKFQGLAQKKIAENLTANPQYQPLGPSDHQYFKVDGFEYLLDKNEQDAIYVNTVTGVKGENELEQGMQRLLKISFTTNNIQIIDDEQTLARFNEEMTTNEMTVKVDNFGLIDISDEMNENNEDKLVWKRIALVLQAKLKFEVMNSAEPYVFY
jgi:hypothetical protein